MALTVIISVSGTLLQLSQAINDLPASIRQTIVTANTEITVTSRAQADNLKTTIDSFKARYPALQVQRQYHEDE